MSQPPRSANDGFVLIVFIVTLVPLLLVAGTYTLTMTGSSNELSSELDHELAFLAAESGVDDAIYKGETGLLKHNVSYSRNLGNGVSFSVEPTHLKVDGKDNDGDGKIDEDDEDVFQVIVTGRYRNIKKRVAAYLGPVPLIPSLTSALAVSNPSVVLDLNGTVKISGFNVDLDKNPIGSGDVPGLTTTESSTAHLLSELDPLEQSMVIGDGGTPSLGTSSSVDLVSLCAQIQNTADLVLTAAAYNSYDFGDGATSDVHVTYRDGNVTFGGNSHGAGIMLVTGDLTMNGNFRFDGVIVVLGNIINSSGTAQIYGGIIQGDSGGLIDFNGTVDVYYSDTAIAVANSTSGKYVAFNGWQNLSAK